VLARPADELAGGGFRDLDDLVDLRVRVPEGLAQHVGGALGGRQSLEHDEHGVVQGLGALGAEGRVLAGVDGLGQPRADVGLATRARRLQGVDGEARRRRREERGRILHDRPVGALPAQPGLLHDVLRLRGAAEHPVRDAEEASAHGLEDGERLVEVLVHLVILSVGERGAFASTG
jgi:hypothetical protein